MFLTHHGIHSTGGVVLRAHQPHLSIRKSHIVLHDLGDLGALDLSCFDFLQDHQELYFFSSHPKRFCKNLFFLKTS